MKQIECVFRFIYSCKYTSSFRNELPRIWLRKIMGVAVRQFFLYDRALVSGLRHRHVVRQRLRCNGCSRSDLCDSHFYGFVFEPSKLRTILMHNLRARDTPHYYRNIYYTYIPCLGQKARQKYRRFNYKPNSIL